MFIAEIGINHNGDLTIAKELILMAKRAGADVVKFQKREVSENITEGNQNNIRHTLSGTMTYREYKNMLEFTKEDYIEIDRFCKEHDILWTASVWDKPSVDFIQQFNVPFIKIPSARINEIDLLEHINKTGIPAVLSVGMSDEKEVDLAIETLQNIHSVLYCKSAYPPKDSELNLSNITYLKNKYPNITIGYSSHDETIYPILCASSLGATVFELHITLSKNMHGTDQSCSFEESRLQEIIKLVEKGKIWLGDHGVHCTESEIPNRTKLRRFI